MWPYWLILILPCVAALLAPQPRLHGPASRSLPMTWWWVILLLTTMAGLRIEVGADWYNYLEHLYAAGNASLGQILTGKDPSYEFLNWASSHLGYGIYGPNVVCGFLFSLGLAVFCNRQPRPWLALVIAVPYLVIVVGMGYTRQAVALGIAMLGLSALERGRTVSFVLWILFAATFHKSAVLLLPVAALSATRNRLWTVAWIGVATFGAYLLFLEEAVDNLQYIYFEREYQSQGALVRLLMNAVPAALLLANLRRFRAIMPSATLWTWFALISLLLLGVLFVSPSSTAIDRIGLYLIPLQLVVFSRLPDLVRKGVSRHVASALVVVYAVLIQYVWLNFSSHADAWLPYRSFLFSTQ